MVWRMCKNTYCSSNFLFLQTILAALYAEWGLIALVLQVSKQVLERIHIAKQGELYWTELHISLHAVKPGFQLDIGRCLGPAKCGSSIPLSPLAHHCWMLSSSSSCLEFSVRKQSCLWYGPWWWSCSVSSLRVFYVLVQVACPEAGPQNRSSLDWL